MAEHTPRPWTHSGLRIGTAAGTICCMYCAADRTGRGQTAGEREANARLIVASPELLAACEYALENLPAVSGGDKVQAMVNVRAELRTAIAKAKGGQS